MNEPRVVITRIAAEQAGLGAEFDRADRKTRDHFQSRDECYRKIIDEDWDEEHRPAARMYLDHFLGHPGELIDLLVNESILEPLTDPKYRRMYRRTSYLGRPE